MKTIGIIGGMSWYSTREYYTVINTEIQQALGGHHSAQIVLSSLDFDQVRALQVAEDWAGAGDLLADHARRLVAAGADLVLIGTNLMHKVAAAVEAAIDVPMIHIGDAVAAQAAAAGVRTLGVLGTGWVMREPFYADRLADHGIRAVAPPESEHELIDRVIFDELTQGQVVPASRAAYVEIIAELAEQGAEAVVLACTEIELLLRDTDCALPLIDSMHAHACYAARLALAEDAVSERLAAGADRVAP